MAQTAEQSLIAALDIGSSKVSAMIARRDDEGRLTVLGTGQRESRGVKRGFITDMSIDFIRPEVDELRPRISVIGVGGGGGEGDANSTADTGSTNR